MIYLTHMTPKKKGFTLIELMIVVIIVNILAMVAAPMMKGNIGRAKKSEAVAALGTIKTAERFYYLEYQSYAAVFNEEWGPGTGLLSTYIKPGDLNGKYFNQNCYHVNGATNNAFYAYCNTNVAGTADTNFGDIYMTESGYISGY